MELRLFNPSFCFITEILLSNSLRTIPEPSCKPISPKGYRRAEDKKMAGPRILRNSAMLILIDHAAARLIVDDEAAPLRAENYLHRVRQLVHAPEIAERSSPI